MPVNAESRVAVTYYALSVTDFGCKTRQTSVRPTINTIRVIIKSQVKKKMLFD